MESSGTMESSGNRIPSWIEGPAPSSRKFPLKFAGRPVTIRLSAFPYNTMNRARSFLEMSIFTIIAFRILWRKKPKKFT
jgi:hypothetical protein